MEKSSKEPGIGLEQAFTITVAGPAGYGINAAGELLGRSFTRGGLEVMAYLEYPSLIRGGVNSTHIRVSAQKVHAPSPALDLLVALTEEAWQQHRNTIKSGGGVMFDPDVVKMQDVDRTRDVEFYPIPLAQCVKKQGGIDLMRNTVAIGAVLGLLKYPLQFLEELLSRQFESKGEKVIEINRRMAQIGYDYVEKQRWENRALSGKLKPTKKPPAYLLSGNAALAYGAMQAGCKLFAAYPMTPASNILTIFAHHEEELNIVVKQPEDEIAAVLYAVGANFAGVRAMTATSGGGFALMNEALSLAGMAEIPLVVVESQRPGPATGLPTWTGQADLQYVIHAGHDEFPKCVLAPGDVTEAFEGMQEAFNIAERYHIPVVVLSDKHLSESLFSVRDLEQLAIPIDRGPLMSTQEQKEREGITTDYPRYRITESGVSPRSLPGMKQGRYVANSNEHDEVGDIEESSENRARMHAKRLRKLESLQKESLLKPILYGPEKGNITLLGWGSTKGPALAALEQLREEGIRANYLHPRMLYPFPTEGIKARLKSTPTTLLLEGNAQGQWGQLIREHTLQDVDHRFLKYNGRPFYPEEIVDKVKSILLTATNYRLSTTD